MIPFEPVASGRQAGGGCRSILCIFVCSSGGTALQGLKRVPCETPEPDLQESAIANRTNASSAFQIRLVLGCSAFVLLPTTWTVELIHGTRCA